MGRAGAVATGGREEDGSTILKISKPMDSKQCFDQSWEQYSIYYVCK